MVIITLPPPKPEFPISPKYQILKAGTTLRRIYNPNKYNATATGFRFNGARARFDHHRFSNDNPQNDPDRGINYCGFTLSCCLVEVFGDTRIIEVDECEAVLLTLDREIKLLDLRKSAAMNAGTVYAINQTADRDLSQSWSRYFYKETAIYGLIDGLIFNNAHNGESAIALYERATPQLNSANIQTLALNSSALRTAIADCAIKNGMVFD